MKKLGIAFLSVCATMTPGVVLLQHFTHNSLHIVESSLITMALFIGGEIYQAIMSSL